MSIDRLLAAGEVPDRPFRLVAAAAAEHHESGVPVVALALGPLVDLASPKRIAMLFGGAVPFPFGGQALSCPGRVRPGVLQIHKHDRLALQRLRTGRPAPVVQKAVRALGRVACRLEELLKLAIDERIMLLPVSMPDDLLGNAQLKDRGFWTSIEHPELNEAITYPGAFFRSSEGGSTFRNRAPLIGEHNDEIYLDELDFTREEMEMLKGAAII